MTSLSKPPIWKVVLSRSGQTTKGYSSSRILSIPHSETPDSYTAVITLNNSDKALVPAGVPIDFENYQVVISSGFKTGVTRSAWAATTAYALDAIRVPTTANGYQYRCAVAGTSHSSEPTWPTDLGVRVTETGGVVWEMDGNSGDEYDRTAPLKVRVQEFHSGQGILKCILRCSGIPDQLKEDKAIAEYTQTSDDTNTVKALIDLVAAAGTGLSSAYNGYTAITVTYDSGYDDSIINSFCPKDYFSISINESRWDKIQELLNYTKCKARIGNDGALHILLPTTTLTTYAYEYKFNVSGSHTFFSKAVRLRFIKPNKEIVASHPDHETQYTGSSTSATSYALDPKSHTTYRRLASNAQAALIAAAIIERSELDDERGFATVPMNVGQELWDYVKVTDSRQGDTRIGNVQYIGRDVEIHLDNQPLTWTMGIAFGKVTMQSLMANLITAGGVSGETYARLSNEQIFALIDDLARDVYIELNKQIDAHNELVAKWNSFVTEGIAIKKLIVTDSLTIPSEAA